MLLQPWWAVASGNPHKCCGLIPYVLRGFMASRDACIHILTQPRPLYKNTHSACRLGLLNVTDVCLTSSKVVLVRNSQVEDRLYSSIAYSKPALVHVVS